MQRLFLLCWFLTAYNLNHLFAQGDFAPIGVEWYYSWATNAIPEDPNREVGYIKLESITDTVLNGQACRKLQRTWIHKDYHNANAPVDTGRSYLYLYSDTNGVFYFDGGWGRFIPLYIFNVAVGDTVIYRVPSLFQPTTTDTLFSMLITDITTSTIGGVQLKTIHHETLSGNMGFGSSLNDPYTERLGILIAYLLCHQPVGIGTNFTPTLRCYNDGEITYRRNENVPCDYIEGTNSIDRLTTNDGAITIYPNPATSLLHIQLRDTKTDLKQLQLYDISGKVVLEKSVSTSKTVLNVTDLSGGFYFLKVTTTDGSILKKVVVGLF